MRTARRPRRHLVAAYFGGPLVTELAFRIVLVACPGGIPHGATFGFRLEIHEDVTPGELVAHLADRLDEDEGDICRALGELESVGLLFTNRKGNE